MTLQEFYGAIGGDYVGVKARFITDERVLKFALKFESDPSFTELFKALDENRGQDAFRAVHTLKGVAQNLGFDPLYRISSEVTEVLRTGGTPETEQMNLLKERYDTVISAVRTLKAEA